MIRNDKWIKSKCMPPLATVSWLMHNPINPDQILRGRVSETIVGDPFTNIDEEVKKLMEKERYVVPSSVLTMLTPDEVIENFKPMIEPFLPMQVRTLGQDRHLKMLNMPAGTAKELRDKLVMDFDGDDVFENTKIISKGLTSFGYDVSLAEDFKIFTNINSSIIDPLNFSEDTLHSTSAKDHVLLPPHSYLLGHTPEYFRMPRNVLALCVGKSTYARCGVIINVTPIEPGFEGHVVVEIANTTSLPVKIYVNQGIAQFIFFEGDDCETSYADRNNGEGGKYQKQTGVTLAKG